MPTWVHDVLDVVFSCWPIAVVGIVLLPLFVASGLRQPVGRAPWAGMSGWRVSVYVALALIWGGDALLGTDRGLAERLAKGSLVLGATFDVAARTIRWLRAGRPDEDDEPDAVASDTDPDERDPGSGRSVRPG